MALAVVAGGAACEREQAEDASRPGEEDSAAERGEVERERASAGASARFTIDQAGKVSLGIYDAVDRLVRELLRGESLEAGEHEVAWDGLDRMGDAVDAGDYEWRLVHSPGFIHRFVTQLGVNPPDGAYRRWVGDHGGPGSVAVDETGLYVSAMESEGPWMILKLAPDYRERLWNVPQYYQANGNARRIAVDGGHLFQLQARGSLGQDRAMLRRLNAADGALQDTWDVRWEEHVPFDLAAHEGTVAMTYPERDAVAMINPEDGQRIQTFDIAGARNVAIVEGGAAPRLLVEGDGVVHSVRPPDDHREVITGLGEVASISYDHATGELFIAVRDGGREVIHRYDSDFQRLDTYGGERRPHGPWQPELFAGINDITATGRGTLMVVEGAVPRRTLELDVSTGEINHEWFGHMPFYVLFATDPQRPDEVWITHYTELQHVRVYYDAGSWQMLGVYNFTDLADRLMGAVPAPPGGNWVPERRDGRLYLVHSSAPAVLRFDRAAGKLVPVALAGHVDVLPGANPDVPAHHARGWTEAVRAAGHEDLATAPRWFTWADADGDGQMDAEEFRLAEQPPAGDPRGNGTLDQEWNFIGPNNLGGVAGKAWGRLPQRGFTGPHNDAPIWDWSQVELGPEPPPHLVPGYWARGVAADRHGQIHTIVHADLHIHDQLHSRWPIGAWRVMRLVRHDAEGELLGLASVAGTFPEEAGTGKLFYPTRIVTGPDDTLWVNDQIYNLAMAFTRDGLFIDNLLGERADDGLPDEAYAFPGNDYQQVAWAQTDDGRLFYFAPGVGVAPVYEIQGWDDVTRQQGVIDRPEQVRSAKRQGDGLMAHYYADTHGRRLVASRVEPTLHWQRDHEPIENLPENQFLIRWHGYLEVPLSEAYSFQSAGLKGNDTVAIYLDDERVFDSVEPNYQKPVSLEAGRRYEIRIDFMNASGTRSFDLRWFSRNTDFDRLPRELLYVE